MSLINKMLQDLDARGGDGARGDAASVVRPVGHGARGGASAAAVGAGVVVGFALLGGAGYAAYKYFRSGAQPVSPPVATQAAVISDAAARKQAGAVGAVSPENLSATTKPEPAAAAAAVAVRPAGGYRVGREIKPAEASGKRLAAQEARSAATAKRVKPVESGALAAAVAAGGVAESGLSSQQKAENEYRRALASLQDARVNEAMAGLEQAVYLYPRHEAARQTLVSLLVEANRPADAIRHLTFATSLDPRQASMAMLLARLQLEHGGNALDTLQRSLPYAEANADYRALLAGVLQRQNKHKEAAEHYQAAVRLQPGNAVWWMGMGISLQAEHRNAEAKVAFQRAYDTGRLAPELQTFVERRLQQLH